MASDSCSSCDELRRTIERLNRRLEDALDTMKDRERDLGQALGFGQQLLENANALEAKLAEKDTELFYATQQVQDKTSENVRLQHRCSTLRGERDQVQSELMATEEEISKLRDENLELTADLAHQKGREAQLKEQLLLHADEVSSLKDELSNALVQKTNLSSDLDRVTADRAKLRESSAKLQTEFLELKCENDALLNVLSQMNKMIAQIARAAAFVHFQKQQANAAADGTSGIDPVFASTLPWIDKKPVHRNFEIAMEYGASYRMRVLSNVVDKLTEDIEMCHAARAERDEIMAKMVSLNDETLALRTQLETLTYELTHKSKHGTKGRHGHGHDHHDHDGGKDGASDVLLHQLASMALFDSDDDTFDYESEDLSFLPADLGEAPVDMPSTPRVGIGGDTSIIEHAADSARSVLGEEIRTPQSIGFHTDWSESPFSPERGDLKDLQQKQDSWNEKLWTLLEELQQIEILESDHVLMSQVETRKQRIQTLSSNICRTFWTNSLAPHDLEEGASLIEGSRSGGPPVALCPRTRKNGEQLRRQRSRVSLFGIGASSAEGGGRFNEDTSHRELLALVHDLFVDSINTRLKLTDLHARNAKKQDEEVGPLSDLEELLEQAAPESSFFDDGDGEW